MTTVAIHQPNYLPWLGYFHKMARCDIFVVFDDVQLARGKSFVVRTRVKAANGVQWLSVPVRDKGELRMIKDVSIAEDDRWQRKHWNTIQLSYRRAPHFAKYEERFRQVYETPWKNLCELNVNLIKLIKEVLGIGAQLVFSSEMNIEATGADKIISIAKYLKADQYITGEGKGSRRYVVEEDFTDNRVELIHQKFAHPIYKQLWGEFLPGLSTIDLLFNEGERSLELLMKGAPAPSPSLEEDSEYE